MKKTLILFIGVIFTALSLTAYSKNTIRISLQLPITHPLGINLTAFKDIVETESKGELEVQIYPSAQLYTDKQVPEAVGSHAIEMGSASLTRFAGSVPEVDAIYLPFLFDTEAKIRQTTAPSSEIRKIIDNKIVEETGARVLWWQAFGRNIYLSKKHPIHTPLDIKGKKVRTYGKLMSWSVEALGGAPTLMSGSKQFLAYQQGFIDVGLTSISGVESRKLYEVMNHMTLTFDSSIEFVAVINNQFFNSLPKRHQSIIIKAGRVVEKQLRNNVQANEQNILSGLRKKINIIELSKTEREHWRTALKPVVDRFMKEGGDDAKKIVSLARKL